MKNIFFLLLTIAVSFSCSKEMIKVEADGFYTDPRDSIVYPYAEIGPQTWMMKNLAYKTAEGSYIYENDEKYVANYGRLYDFNAALKACPEGWHLPTDKEWKELEIFVGMDPAAADSTEWRRSGETALAIKNNTGWWSGGNGDNTSKFSALPGGFRTEKGASEMFGDIATFWTSSSNTENHAWGRAMVYYEVGIYRWKYNKQEANSVRCLKD